MRLSFFVSGLVCLSATASASFDMMLLPDVLSGGITRYDPINRLRLGSFATQTSLSWHSVNLASTPGQAYLTNPQTMLYNYSTGVATGSNAVPIGVTAGNLNGTRFAEADGNTAYFFNSNMSGSSSYTPSFTTMFAVAPIGSDRSLMLGVNSAGALVLTAHNATNGAINTRVLAASGDYVASTVSALTLLSDNGSQAKIGYTYRSISATVYDTVTVSYSTLASTSAFRTFTTFSATANVGVLRAHDGVYLVGRDSASPSNTRITALNSLNIPYANYITADVQVPTSRWVGANVMAPEPASLVGFALGAAMLARRRSKS